MPKTKPLTPTPPHTHTPAHLRVTAYPTPPHTQRTHPRVFDVYDTLFYLPTGLNNSTLNAATVVCTHRSTHSRLWGKGMWALYSVATGIKKTGW